MRIVILSRNSRLYSTRRLADTARSRGHEVAVVDPRLVQLRVETGQLDVCFDNATWPELDVIIPRVGVGSGSFALSVVRQFDWMDVPTLNDAQSIALAHDKLRSLQLLSASGVLVPATACTHSPQSIEQVLDAVGGCPVIVKLQRGSHGVGTMIAETPEAVTSMLQTFWAMGQDIVLQRFVSESRGTDLRVIVVGGKVVAAMRRKAPPGEFRSNLHRGGMALAVRIDRKTASVACRAARLLGLEVAGVDLVESARGPMVLEVNSSPGLKGIERATARDVASAIIEHAEKVAARRHKSYHLAAKRKSKSKAIFRPNGNRGEVV